MSRAGHLILVGLPGAGKTTTGRRLARLLGRPFVDFDEEIERRDGRTVARLFAEEGEPAFRALERALTAELASRPPMVLSPGGGWVTIPEVVALLRPPGRIIHLRVPPAVALRRLGAGLARRPLLAGDDPLARLEQLYERRKSLYEAADVVIDVETLTPQQVARKLAELATGEA